MPFRGTLLNVVGHWCLTFWWPLHPLLTKTKTEDQGDISDWSMIWEAMCGAASGMGEGILGGWQLHHCYHHHLHRGSRNISNLPKETESTFSDWSVISFSSGGTSVTEDQWMHRFVWVQYWMQFYSWLEILYNTSHFLTPLDQFGRVECEWLETDKQTVRWGSSWKWDGSGRPVCHHIIAFTALNQACKGYPWPWWNGRERSFVCIISFQLPASQTTKLASPTSSRAISWCGGEVKTERQRGASPLHQSPSSNSKPEY